jgi:predicted glycogen debranching enzyme
MASDGGSALLAESEVRDRDLLVRAQLVGDGADAAIAGSNELQALVLAADDFLVRRRIPATPGPADPAAPVGWSVIAGYPWFNDWGRDTAIALRGLTLATGRPEIGATVLRSFAPWVRRGLLPNNFPDRVDEMPEYHTIDAPLWYIEAARAHVAATGDHALGAELLPTLLSIIAAYRDGTDFGIGADSDGLIVGSAEGRQLTWMDAKLDDWVVTPRRGKPIEISALWYRALRSVSAWLRDPVIGAGVADAARVATELDQFADHVRTSFRARFIRTEVPWLADVVDGPDGDDLALRPNQFIALGLGGDLIPPAEAQRAFAAADAELRAAIGIRSLAPSDPAYRGDYDGDRKSRDGAYHQGLGWLWLIGPWADSAFAVHDLTNPSGRAAAVTLVTEALAPYRAHLREAGLGTISENATGDAPFTPVACFAQAWSVSELLRIERRVAALRANAPESQR